MSASIKPESADLAEIKTRLKAGVAGNYYFVALLGLRNCEPLKTTLPVESYSSTRPRGAERYESCRTT